VVFVTAHDAFALRAFEVNALDYLMKPSIRLGCARRSSGRWDEIGQRRARSAGLRGLIFLAIDHRPRLVRLATIVCIRARRLQPPDRQRGPIAWCSSL